MSSFIYSRVVELRGGNQTCEGLLPKKIFLSKCRIIKLLLIVLFAGLAIYALSLPLQRHPYSPPHEYLNWKLEKDAETMDRVVENGRNRRTVLLEHELYHYDASMKYKIIPFAFVGSEWAAAPDMPVCIATHSSVSRMHSLAEFLLSWNGTASVALFMPGPEVEIVRFFLEYLLFCYPEALQHVSFHLVHPVDWPPTESPLPDRKGYECEADPKKIIDELLPAIGINNTDSREKEIVYPQNILRNTANRACPTEWVMTLDVDMIPPPSLNQRLKKFLTSNENENCNKCAFVLPTYEVQLPNLPMAPLEKIKRIPSTKKDLLRLIRIRYARQFHINVFKENQKAAQLTRWEKLWSTPNDDIHVAYPIKYLFWYEPVFIARRGFPPFDERFIGFGMTRNTQAYEMFLAGYIFKLLDNAFLVHWGFQDIKNRPWWRTVQVYKNGIVFKSWLLEKSVAYDADPLHLIQAKCGDQSERKVRVILAKNYKNPLPLLS